MRRSRKDGGAAIGVIGSNRTTNEEAYLLSKFARTVLKTNNVDHHRTADFPAFASAMRGKENATASMADVFTAPAILLIGNDPTEQHPLLAWQIRNNVRLQRAKLYVINSESIKLRRQATSFTRIPTGTEGKVASFLAGDDAAADALGSTKDEWRSLRDKIRAEQNLVIIFGSEIRGKDIASLISFSGNSWRDSSAPRITQIPRCRRHSPTPTYWRLSSSRKQQRIPSRVGRHSPTPGFDCRAWSKQPKPAS